MMVLENATFCLFVRKNRWSSWLEMDRKTFYWDVRSSFRPIQIRTTRSKLFQTAQVAKEANSKPDVWFVKHY